MEFCKCRYLCTLKMLVETGLSITAFWSGFALCLLLHQRIFRARLGPAEVTINLLCQGLKKPSSITQTQLAKNVNVHFKTVNVHCKTVRFLELLKICDVVIEMGHS